MIYVALLRGINVGGKNKVAMAQLKLVFESLGFTKVKTYINSGNVIFCDIDHTFAELAPLIEQAIEDDFGFHVHVVVRSLPEIQTIAKTLSKTWVNDQDMKCDVIFLWEEVDNKKVLEQLVIKPGIDDVQYVAGAILWRVDRADASKSGLMKIIGTDLYKKMTIRNANTLRKLLILMQEA